MDFYQILNTSLFAWALVGILMLMLAVLAFLKGRHKISDKAGIGIIVFVLLGTMIALTLGNFIGNY